MKKIKKVAIIGAGAMGAYFASQFFKTDGFSTTLIARGDRLKRLNTKGIIVNKEHYLIPASDPDQVISPMDLIIVALKHHHLEDAVHGLNKLMGDSTTIISVMNGLESEEYIGSIYGMDKMLYAVSVGIDALRDNNEISFSKPGIHYFGEADNKQISPKVLAVQQAFNSAGIVYETPDDMLRILWWKFMINVGMNQASAVMGAPYGIFQESAEAQSLMEALMKEVILLANAIDINLTGKDIEDWYGVLKTLAPHGKTSTLQDIEAKRKTEIEIFGGRMTELGKTHGIATPVNQTMYQIIKVLEEHF